MRMSQPICDADQNDGLDIAVPVGTPVLATEVGTVLAVWNDKIYGCGLSVTVKYQDGAVAGFTWLSDTMVYVGESVKQSQVIAHSGRAGNATSPQLHYTLFTDAEGKIDPRQHKQFQPDMKEFADPNALDRALRSLAAEPNLSLEEKKRIAAKLDAQHHAMRILVEEEYQETLRKATDAWYANGRRWRRIPPGIWTRLRKADQGRFQNGIDPEINAPGFGPNASSHSVP